MASPRQQQQRIDVDAVKASYSLLSVAQAYGLTLRRTGREFSCLSPFKPERTPSFFIDDHKGLFKDFASGEGGDVIRFVQLMDSCDFVTALRRLAADAGLDDPVERDRRAMAYAARAKSLEEQEAARTARHIGFAADIWKGCTSALGTPVETYLAARGIDLGALETVYGWRVPPTIQYHHAVRYRREGERCIGPAMIGLVTREVLGRRQLAGVHRTWLAADGAAKAPISKPKMTLGSVFGACTRLSPVAPVAVIGEGYETTLSVMAELARHGEAVFGVSGLFLDNICGAGVRSEGAPRDEISMVPDERRPGVTMPSGVSEVILLKDADGQRPQDIDRFIRRAATKFQRAGLRVRVASPELGSDFNDMVRGAAA